MVVMIIVIEINLIIEVVIIAEGEDGVELISILLYLMRDLFSI